MSWTAKKLKKVFNILNHAPQLQHAPVEYFSLIMGTTPFMVLLSTILSLRTKDETTGPAALRLFEYADTPQAIVKLGVEKIAQLIFPVGFYKTKATNIIKLSEIIIEKYNGYVPQDMDELLSLPNVGRKTANMVLGQCFQIPSVCVDIHVHRISNRWGLCQTKTPEETEIYIRQHIPQELWLCFNKPMVALGQVICRPVSPKCAECPISECCEKKIGR